MKWLKRQPKITVVVNFYNMRREAFRTLYSLGIPYQIGIESYDYEVIVVDNGSDQPLCSSFLSSLDRNFRYLWIETDSPSPAKALNESVKHASGEWVLCCIDGARILSPCLLKKSLQAIQLFPNPFVYTLGMHIGNKPQNFSIEEGYNQQVEDELLRALEWQKNGYELFSVSSVALSSKNGYFSEFSESNAFCLRKKDFIDAGGFDERFQSRGGGLVNLDFFNKMHEYKKMQPILLLGEATFHQFHGGVATNKKIADHPWDAMELEYQQIYGRSFESSYYPPVYYGDISKEARWLLGG